MAATTPFQPVTASVTGKSVVIAAISSSASLNAVTISSSGGYAPSLLVTNASAVTLFVRLSSEAAPVASSTDVPISPNSQRVFSNPVPLGTVGIGVAASIFGAGTVIITPGQGGI